MINADKLKQLNIPNLPGSYQFFNKKGELIYVGKAVNLKSRVGSYFRESANLSPAKQRMISEIERIEFIEVATEIEALLLEANLIKKFQPYYNVLLRDDKRFLYIKVDTEAEIPTITTSRQIDKSGKYFGPFVSSLAVRETLKTIRKIWPYCTAKKITSTPCFYYQVGRCLGICGGKISKAEYNKQVIKPIISFLEGKKTKIIADLKKQIKASAKAGKEEEASLLQWRLRKMEEVLAGARVISVGDKYENDVVELAKLLSLPKIPERIEGYDLSSIFGTETVGVMVVFSGGEADKSQYRKFKIKSGAVGDTDMLAEVLERRFKNDWPLPDLLLLDGGKGQLNTASRILKKLKLNIQLVAISKGEGLRSSIAPDKIFFPGQTKALELPLASPALHLLKRVRDESHRFAIGYHREIRSRNFLPR